MAERGVTVFKEAHSSSLDLHASLDESLSFNTLPPLFRIAIIGLKYAVSKETYVIGKTYFRHKKHLVLLKNKIKRKVLRFQA